MPKTFTGKVETIDGRMGVRGRSGAVYFLDDFDSVAEARKAALDMLPHHCDDDDDDDDDDGQQINE
ncbi:MAG TPA: hypothetical protein VG826_05330 [Pirellulales bacterium]|nr:hypothetical protein [Pirellulales bacterium]